MNLKVIRTHSKHKDYHTLVSLLDKEIQKRDGEDFGFYNQFNSSENINEVVLVYENGSVLGCGTIKRFDDKTTEIKRMFTLYEARGKGVATLILDELCLWAKELNYERLILETGKKYHEAISLYVKYGFKQISNYGPYEDVDESVCFSFTI